MKTNIKKRIISLNIVMTYPVHWNKYDIGAIYLKSTIFKYGQYYNALATYIHEFCHIFGGDSSDNFSKGLTVAMEILLANHTVVEKGKLKWNNLYGRKGAS